MMRKINFWSGRNQKPRTSSRGRASGARRSRSLRNAILGFEWLEDRCLLAVTPVLSIESGQFFAVGGSFTPFRASFHRRP